MRVGVLLTGVSFRAKLRGTEAHSSTSSSPSPRLGALHSGGWGVQQAGAGSDWFCLLRGQWPILLVDILNFSTFRTFHFLNISNVDKSSLKWYELPYALHPDSPNAMLCFPFAAPSSLSALSTACCSLGEPRGVFPVTVMT